MDTRLALVFAVLPLGCASQRVPDPKPTLDAYVKAAQAGDAEALHAMLTDKSRERLGKEGTARAVAEGKDELRDLAVAASSKDAEVRSQARVALDDGDTATLVLEGGAFRISRADGLPVAAKTPQEALASLRKALVRAELGPLSRTLSREVREAAQRDVAALLRDLSHPSRLDVRVTGDRATCVLPSGHSVKLRRRAGVWSVEDFD